MSSASPITATVDPRPSLGGSEHRLATAVLSQHRARPGGHARSVGRVARSQAPEAARRVKVQRPQSVFVGLGEHAARLPEPRLWGVGRLGLEPCTKCSLPANEEQAHKVPIGRHR
jgi:hypothetical protein